MKNKSRFIGSMVLLLMALLVLGGCPTGTSGTETQNPGNPPSNPSGPSGPSIPTKTPVQLASELVSTLNRGLAAGAEIVERVGSTVTVKNNFTVGTGPGEIAAVTIPGGVTFSVPDGKTVTIAGGTTTVSAGGKVEVAGNGTLTKTGGTFNFSPGAVVFKVDLETTDIGSGSKGLNDRITGAKKLGPGTVMELTPDFYEDVENNVTTAIVTDAGPDRNTIPYTIKGQGTADDDPSLPVGILLANDKVTLDEMKVEITIPTQAAITTSNTRYTAGISISRYDGTSILTGDNLANNDVTVKNCKVTYAIDPLDTNTSYTHNAGIYVSGASGPSVTPRKIIIEGNTVETSGRGTAAAQGVVVQYYDPSIVIKNNTLSSGTGGAETVNAPAAALFLNINPATITDPTVSPQITGNTLDGHNIDFYVNIFSTGDYKGVEDLFNSKFGTYYSTWATDTTDNFYRKLYTALIGQSKATGYAGLFFMVLGGTAGSYDGYCFVYEAWEKSSGVVTAVDYWGATILSSGTALAYNAGSGSNMYDTDAAAGTSGNGHFNTQKAGYRGRINLTTDPKSYDNFKFHPTDGNSQGSYSWADGVTSL
ncbi:hypothetical protein LQZ21_01950 [Treponema sp. TIM-1]|uniref:hypothetical protein n=1 Tax=Treponema sp. TIM-1 TaxID=2898417 RepID=UPI00398135CD